MKEPQTKKEWKDYSRQVGISEKYLRFKSGREHGRFGLMLMAVLFGLIVPAIVFIFEKPHFDIEGKGELLLGFMLVAAFLLGVVLGEAGSDEVWLGKLKRRDEP